MCLGGEEGVRQTNGRKTGGKMIGTKYSNRVCATGWQQHKEKKDFWQDLERLIETVSQQERIVLGVDLNRHVGKGNIGDEEIMGRTKSIFSLFLIRCWNEK